MIDTITQNNYQRIYAPLLQLIVNVDELYSRKSEFDEHEIQTKVSDLCREAFELSNKVSSAGTEEEIITIEVLDLIESLIVEVKTIFTDFLSNLKGQEKLFFKFYRSLLTQEVDWSLLSITSFEDFSYAEIEEIDVKGLNNFDPTNYKKSLLVLPPLNLEEKLNDFINSIEDINILLSLIFSFKLDQEMPEGDNIALIGSDFLVDKNQLVAYIRLKKVSMGDVLHNSFTYEELPNIGERTGWSPQNSYQQFDDIINVLSEYNQQIQILDKFLKIYQVLENFKYRSKIAGLIDEYGEKMFSIRRLKTLYSQIESGEEKELKLLIKSILNLDCNGNSMNDILSHEWDDFKTNLDITKLKGELKEIGCRTEPQISESFLSSCIYALRNSIAHNKETEIHLTQGSLHEYPEIGKLISGFLLMSLENMVYSLLIEESFIWYNQANFSLYKQI